MAASQDLSLEAIRDFMLENGGRVTNHDLVKHFKGFLTNPETRVEARNQFKEFVNTVATIRNEGGEKYLILKKKYRNAMGQLNQGVLASPVLPSPSSESVSSTTPTSMNPLSYFSASEESLDVMSPSRHPPPYRSPPPPAGSPIHPGPQTTSFESANMGQEGELEREKDTSLEVRSPSTDDSLKSSAGVVEETVIHAPPPVPPRRKSSDRIKLENKENVADTTYKRPKITGSDTGNKMDASELDSEQKISVKERMQKFNRLAETDAKTHFVSNKKKTERGVDDDDSASVTTLDVQSREWLVVSSQANYQALAKLAANNPRLARFKTALHWAAKHGNADIVKLIAGTYQVDVNARSGYTPLHLAMQYSHEEIYDLLHQTYGADPNLRDWSGRKPHQYQPSQYTSVSADTSSKIKARKKHAEKDLRFLRIGSLNVRVKRTTEAFSNFLGVGQSSEKLHKTWGSADNIQQVDRHMMPPPKFAPIKKRRSKRAQDFAMSHSMPSTPPSEPRTSSRGAAVDSDSDTACGFGSNWQSTV